MASLPTGPGCGVNGCRGSGLQPGLTPSRLPAPAQAPQGAGAPGTQCLQPGCSCPLLQTRLPLCSHPLHAASRCWSRRSEVKRGWGCASALAFRLAALCGAWAGSCGQETPVVGAQDLTAHLPDLQVPSQCPARVAPSGCAQKCCWATWGASHRDCPWLLLLGGVALVQGSASSALQVSRGVVFGGT